MAKAREPQPFTIRNDRGQYLATYRARTAEQAIAQHVRDQAAFQAHFRRNEIRIGSLTAAALWSSRTKREERVT